jgi:hypothetical protein
MRASRINFRNLRWRRVRHQQRRENANEQRCVDKTVEECKFQILIAGVMRRVNGGDERLRLMNLHSVKIEIYLIGQTAEPDR